MTLNINLEARSGRMCLPFYKKDAGINQHNWFTALFVRIFGSGIIEQAQKDGRTFYFNKASLVKWTNNMSKIVHSKLNAYEEVSLSLKDTDDKIAETFRTVVLQASVINSKVEAQKANEAEEKRLAGLAPQERIAEEAQKIKDNEDAAKALHDCFAEHVDF